MQGCLQRWLLAFCCVAVAGSASATLEFPDSLAGPPRETDDSIVVDADAQSAWGPPLLRDARVRACARACRGQPAAERGEPGGAGGVFFVHMSKAGGSSLKAYFRRLLCIGVLPLPRTWASEHYPMRHEWFNGSSVTFVTALRDPIDRIISAYWCAVGPDPSR